MTRKSAALFVKALKEEGIEELYISRAKKEPSKVAVNPISSKIKQTAVPSVSPTTPGRMILDNDSLRVEMTKLRDLTHACKLCPELAKHRTNVVFGSGNMRAKLMFVGEAPGADEDEQGLPFIGRAGQLLTKIIESIGLRRESVFIANTLKCRPPENRAPHPDEISKCAPFLQKQIELIQPKIICALGTHAAQSLLQTQTPISQLRGKFHPFLFGSRLIATFHPAYLLRNPPEKIKVWEDMKLIKKELDLLES